MEENRRRRTSQEAGALRPGISRPAGSQVRRGTGTAGTRVQAASRTGSGTGRTDPSQYGDRRRTSGTASRSTAGTRTATARATQGSARTGAYRSSAPGGRAPSGAGRSSDPRVAQARRRAAIRRRKQKQRRMLFMGVGAALLILIVVLIAIPGKNSKDGKVDPTPTEIVAEVPAETAPELTIEEPVTEEGTEETQTVEDTSTAGTASAPVTTTYCDYEIRDGIPNTVNPIGIGECEQVDDSYFDDAVFVGDSVTLGLAKTVKNQRKKDLPNLLGQAQFLTCGGMGIRDTLMSVSEKSLHPVYQGEKMLVEDALAKMGAKKIFLMLGMNDIVMASTEENVQNMMKLLVRIREKNPDAIIFIESCTPRAVGEYKKLNNNALFEFDIALYEECKKYEDMGLYFIDIGYALRDDQGWLPEEYCGDLGSERLHMSAKGCKAWITYLYTHALREA